MKKDLEQRLNGKINGIFSREGPAVIEGSVSDRPRHIDALDIHQLIALIAMKKPIEFRKTFKNVIK